MSVKLRTKKLSDGSESYYLDLYIKGIRQYEFLGIKIKKNDPERKHKKEIAEAKRSKRELELLANYHDVPKTFNGDDDFLEFFDRNAFDKATKSVKNNFQEFIKERLTKEKLPFKLVSQKLIEDYKAYLEQNEKKNGTVCNYIIKIKTALNKAVKEGYLSKNPAKYVKLKLHGVEKIYLTTDEIKQLIKTASPDEEVKRAFIFSCFTGLRISDVKKLTWSSIKDDKLFFSQTKTKGFEYLPLPETALKYLYLGIDKANIKPDEFIFKLWDDQTTNKRLKKWVEIAKLKKHVTYHTARHTFATLSLSSGIDIYTVSKMMGHKSVNMTEIYAKIINKSVEDAITRLPSL